MKFSPDGTSVDCDFSTSAAGQGAFSIFSNRRVLKPGGRLVLVDSLQRGDQLDYEGLLELFPQNYHEPYYESYTNEDFSALAISCGMTQIRDVRAFVSKVMVFDKPARRAPAVLARNLAG
jgi:hypothetical protein